MSRVNLNGIGISVRVVNSSAAGPAALLIHGLNTNLAFWHPLLVRQLSASRRLIMYDQRGHGDSDLPPSGYTSADLAGDAAALLDAYQLDSADVIAHSFGATVALQLLRLHPKRVRSLVILDGRTRLLQPEVRIGDWSQFARWQQHFQAAGIVLDPELELDFELPLHISSEMWASAREGLAKEGFFVPGRGARAMAKYTRLLKETTAPHDFRQNAGLTRESLRQITIPVVAVYGANSPYLPTARGLLDEIPGCGFVSIPGGGHNFPFLQPDATLAAIEDFWATSFNKGTLPS